jgi:uncharacterized protein (DUF427 family)
MSKLANKVALVTGGSRGIRGPDHPITISPAEGKVRVSVAGRIIGESTQALRLEERGYPPVYYLPRRDADMSLLVRTTHYSYCPYKGLGAARLFPITQPTNHPNTPPGAEYAKDNT